MRYYFRYRRWIDAFISLLLTLFIFHPPEVFEIFEYVSPNVRDDLALSLVGTGSSLLGFILAASTFLISHLQNEKFALIRSSKSFKQLPELISSSLWRLLTLTIGSALLLFVQESLLDISLMILNFLVVLNVLALSATIWIVLKIYALPISG